MKQWVLQRITCTTMPYKSRIRLLRVAHNPANGFPARLLVAKPDAKIISVGGRVGSFLLKKGLYGHVGTVPHYSGQAAGHWGHEIPGREREFKRFKSELGGIHSWTHKPYQSCDAGHEYMEVSPTDTQAKLLFDYQVRFKRIRQQERTGWRQQQREWQHRLTET